MTALEGPSQGNAAGIGTALGGEGDSDEEPWTPQFRREAEQNIMDSDMDSDTSLVEHIGKSPYAGYLSQGTRSKSRTRRAENHRTNPSPQKRHASSAGPPCLASPGVSEGDRWQKDIRAARFEQPGVAQPQSEKLSL